MMKPTMVVSVRMPDELRGRLSRRAERDVRSLSQEIVWLLTYALEEIEAEQTHERVHARAV